MNVSPIQMPVLVPASTEESRYRLVAEDWCISIGPLTIRIKSGFVTDGASVPELLQRVAGRPFDVPRVAAAVVHDWLYSAHITSRLFADLVFLAIMIKVGYPVFRSLADFWAVRSFGRSSWESDCDPIQIEFARACGCITTTTRQG